MFSTKSYRTVLVVTENGLTRRIMKRVTRHLPPLKLNFCKSLEEAEVSLLSTPPGMVVFDVSRLEEEEIRGKLEPFLLNLPGWIRTFFLDHNPTESRVKLASELGVKGILKAPASHYGINAIFKLLISPKSSTAKASRKVKDGGLAELLADLATLQI